MKACVSVIGTQWFIVEDGKAMPRTDRWSALVEACAINAR